MDLHAGLDAVFQLPPAFDHEEAFFAAKSGFLLEGQQVFDTWVLCACYFHFLLGFKFQVSGFKFQVSGFRFQVSGFRFQDSGFRFQDSGFREHVLFASYRTGLQRTDKLTDSLT